MEDSTNIFKAIKRHDPFKKFGSFQHRIFGAPQKYVQAPGLLNEVGLYLDTMHAHSVALIHDPKLDAYKQVKESLLRYHAAKEVKEYTFSGECSWSEVKRIIAAISSEMLKTDFVLGIGGGKTLDLAKAVAYALDIPIVIVPTLASTDAPCSALSVVYTPHGDFQEYAFYPMNPKYVLVDTALVASAPPRFLASGMGDAMATFYEADVCFRNPAARTCQGGRPTVSAYSLASLCMNILYSHGYDALQDAKKGQVTENLEKVVEANTLLSGLGFESGGLAAAHAIHNGLTVHPSTHEYMHGEKVAFGTIAQLCMDNEETEAQKVISFFCQIGLPVTLEQVGLKETDQEGLYRIAERACQKDETIHNHSFQVTSEMVVKAMLDAHHLGKRILQNRPSRHGQPVNLIELGAGDGGKTLILLKELLHSHIDFQYVPIDISELAMKELINGLKTDFQDSRLQCFGLVGDYKDGLQWLAAQQHFRKNFVLFLGSSIGNFTQENAIRFIRGLAQVLRNGDKLLLGADLLKDPFMMTQAYTDKSGVIADFNLNLLDRINRELDANFDIRQWYHYAYYQSDIKSVESLLISKISQKVFIAVGLEFTSDAFEPIHTEHSHKYSIEELRRIAHYSGMKCCEFLFDESRWFVDCILRVKPHACSIRQ
eukprot:jgi/Galph1/5153/GphlegSOOS_G3716.1